MTKRKQIVALLVGVLLLAGAAGTFAWLSVTGVLVNEFGFGSVAPSVDETLKDNVKRDVSVKNTGSAPAYLRVAVDIYWQDKDGARLWDEPVAGTDGQNDTFHFVHSLYYEIKKLCSLYKARQRIRRVLYGFKAELRPL